MADCLKQLVFADEIIVLDQNSTDDTIEIAKKYSDKVYAESLPFDKARNALASYAKGDWLLYVDADERLSPELIEEIRSTTSDQRSTAAYYIPRKNMILGKFLRHGGWWPDYVPRLFKKEKLTGWQGRIHESPKVDGKFGYIKSPITHLTARSMKLMLEKSAKWAKIEAELNFENNAGPVTPLKVIKALTSEFITRYVIKLGFLDGFVGLVESMYQAYHRAMILTYLWELQNE
ncbi:MAG: glycosyltransferase family 2 protein [Candidatus Curtissbacteria bacterium]|nr:glycosyltransferase family 2 protein [Candidatus Curtissbacteria bacterium]